MSSVKYLGGVVNEDGHQVGHDLYRNHDEGVVAEEEDVAVVVGAGQRRK